MTIRVVLCHQSTFLRDVLRILASTRDVVVVGEADGPATLLDLCGAEQPDVVLTEASFGDGTVVEDLLAELLAGGTKVAVLCDDPSPERLTGILARGASGFLRPSASPDEVVEALRSLAVGAAALEPEAAGTILEQWRRLRAGSGSPSGSALPSLTAREHDVLEAMTDGLATKAVAQRLGMAVKTVENHKTRVFDKLGVRTQAAAVSFAISNGLLASGPSALES